MTAYICIHCFRISILIYSIFNGQYFDAVIKIILQIFFLPTMYAAIAEEPEFTDIIENVTVPAGRNVRMACSVKNLGSFKVNQNKKKFYSIFSSYFMASLSIGNFVGIKISVNVAIKYRINPLFSILSATIAREKKKSR